MEEVLEQNFEDAFAIAWNENQGNYSETIAKKTVSFLKNQGLKVKTVLDLCCGSANFLSEMKDNGMKCTGTEILDSYIEYDKSKYKDIEFVKTESLLDFENLDTFDLISCNHDMINTLPTLDDWSTFFSRAYNHLSNGGILIFDYYTKRRLQDWNEVTYNENENLDYIRNVTSSQTQNKTTISSIYYINLNPNAEIETINGEKVYKFNDSNNKYKRTEDTLEEYYFENSEILNRIKQSGYRYLITTDANFSPVSSISDMNRMHIIAIKLENNQN